jgi:hypothetical protein
MITVVNFMNFIMVLCLLIFEGQLSGLELFFHVKASSQI